ncbi:GNAT family N-acetyltransferase [Ureibacillus chungkukjangi]|uniref:Acetyltransferase (GNAT) family protein n=1 Tax=Ureibacillus chungkukjangi TaxID=1202712 RepID=A0A318TTU4_9BACL|nr:GNAT family protein [Ureibacillus chungkukjangi]PYF08276.1 acetyltransferase (GNAT) family protein [Ureibacillus chungkukjangi]
MKLKVYNMNNQFAIQILNWKYKPPYDFYNNEYSKEALEELLNSSYYALVDTENELFGFFCTGKSAQVPAGHAMGAYEERLVDMGLGMNPMLVGEGRGAEFCLLIIKLIEQDFQNAPIRLTVAKFNKRAIHLYRKLGFIEEHEFQTDRAEFMTMVRRRG